MARVDYFGILSKVKEDLESNELLLGINVVVEEELDFSVAMSPWIGIYLMRRDHPFELQRLTAGRETGIEIRLSIWVWCWSMESKAVALQQRDDLLGKVEIALMPPDRSWGNMVQTSWLEGGDLPSARSPENEPLYLAGGEIIMVMQTAATMDA